MSLFSPEYGALRRRQPVAAEGGPGAGEAAVQALWHAGLPQHTELETAEGHRLRVLSPGYWNRAEGPDFKGAQLAFNGALQAGDVEVHLGHGGWRAHGHHEDPRYNGVILHVVWDVAPPPEPPVTAAGRRVATLLLAPLFPEGLDAAEARLADGSGDAPVHGRCAALIRAQGTGPLLDLLDLAGEWRMLEKTRALDERMDRVGPDQAVYEAVAAACGFSRFKYPFSEVARHLPYERAHQLAAQDGFLLEAAFLRIAGLLPETLGDDAPPVPHFERLRTLCQTHLPGLRPLPLNWPRGGVRPANNPERRVAGMARILARTAEYGLVGTLERTWMEDLRPVERRRAFEKLFPPAVGFWADHCTWTGKRAATPSAPLGAGRVRSIIGNVFIPAALALARNRGDRHAEETIHAFFRALPGEPGNRVLRHMAPRLFGHARPPRLGFQRQQGLLALHQDWCEPNPACRACPLLPWLDRHAGPTP